MEKKKIVGLIKGLFNSSVILGLCSGITSGSEPTFSWTSDGVAICEATGEQDEEFPFPQIISDSSGGAIISWQDKRNGNYDIYAQKIDSSGTVSWTENGIAICTAENDQKLNPPAPDNYPYLELICSDTSGGAIIAWKDYRSGNWDIYAQRIDASGDVQWTENGVAICTEGHDQELPQLTSDTSGGAIITWQDKRNGNYNLYAQRIDADGTVRWTENGAVICNANGDQTNPRIISDSSNGAIVVWHDERNPDRNIYAQRIDSDGNALWTENGVAISEKTDCNQWFPQIISDGSGGAIISWNDTRRSAESGYELDFNVYVQRIDADGNRLWSAEEGDYDGIAITYKDGRQEDAVLISDGSGGAIIAWDDDSTEQDEPTDSAYFNIYAQRIDSDGNVQWTSNGVAICTADDEQTFPEIISDISGGAIIAWHDKRSGNYDIYIQRIDSDGNALWTENGVAVCSAASEQAFPRITSNGSGGAIIAWQDYRNSQWDIYTQKVTLEDEDSTGESTGESDGGSDRCFIATAVYGTPMAKEVKILKQFRDEYLLTNPLGKDFVSWYYKISPPIAKFIREHPSLKKATKPFLMSLIWIVEKRIKD